MEISSERFLVFFFAWLFHVGDVFCVNSYFIKLLEKLLQYGNASVEGFYGNDTIRFGSVGTSQLIVPGTVFGQAVKLHDYFIGVSLYEQMIMLGF